MPRSPGRLQRSVGSESFSRLKAVSLQAYLVLQWVFLSSTIILFNKHLLSTARFHYPISLVIMHMVFVSACAFVWKRCGWVQVPTISWREILNSFAPVAVCQALSLGLGNTAYLFITVAFVQMLKASTPVAVLLVSFAVGLERPSKALAVYIFLIASGVTLACYGQLQLDVIGVAVQVAAVGCEALRLCLVNIALKGYKLSPIASLYFIAPLVAVALLPGWLLFEAASISRNQFQPVRRVGFAVLLLNASVAFLLNVATMALIKHTSALTLNVSGVFKDVLLILWSVVVSGAIVTKVQYAGYGVAIVGVCGYMRYKTAQQQQQQQQTAAKAEQIPKDAEAQPLAVQSEGEEEK